MLIPEPPEQTRKMKGLIHLLLALYLIQPYPTVAQEQLFFRLNQIGYLPNQMKQAVILAKAGSAFSVQNEQNQVVYSGQLTPGPMSGLSNEILSYADFTALHDTGSYRLFVKDLGYSPPFRIKNHVFDPAMKAATKGFYFLRMSTPLLASHAGKWSRPMAHPDDALLFHPSSGHSEGSYSSPGGWYDAGDYNKYTLNGAFSVGVMLALAEEYPDLMPDGSLNIPESQNGKNDLLDELRYELEWLLTMQDEDGGCYHKITAKRFEGFVMPDQAVSQRYVVGKGSSATLNFAACMAQASRVYARQDPVFAFRCLEASKAAWDWELKHPDVVFRNPADISTGEYGDRDFADERYWAAAELYTSTHDSRYLETINQRKNPVIFRFGANWQWFQANLGTFSLLRHSDGLPADLVRKMQKALLDKADGLLQSMDTLDYRQPVSNFQWGSNSDELDAAMILAEAYRNSGKPDYMTGIVEINDYIFGKNATGYSFLTGAGARPPMHIHHRQSGADSVTEPVPGLLAGGPNQYRQDVRSGAVYPEHSAPMQCYVDQEASYASNEICLNWNAPLVYVLGFLEQNAH